MTEFYPFDDHEADLASAEENILYLLVLVEHLKTAQEQLRQNVQNVASALADGMKALELLTQIVQEHQRRLDRDLDEHDLADTEEN